MLIHPHLALNPLLPFGLGLESWHSQKPIENSVESAPEEMDTLGLRPRAVSGPTGVREAEKAITK
jgi:hypothetical protein